MRDSKPRSPAPENLKISWRRSRTNEQKTWTDRIELHETDEKKLATVRVVHFLRKRRLKMENFHVFSNIFQTHLQHIEFQGIRKEQFVKLIKSLELLQSK